MKKNVNCNKFGVPYHKYEIVLNNGSTKCIDIGCEEDWGDVQQVFKDTGFGKFVEIVGWGNDSDGHIEIVNVIDCETNQHIIPIEWAHNCVWNYIDNYCA